MRYTSSAALYDSGLHSEGIKTHDPLEYLTIVFLLDYYFYL